LLTGACLAVVGIEVSWVVIDQKKIESLKNGILSFYQPGLKNIVLRNFEKGRLHFTTDLSETIVDSPAASIAMVTPSGEDGSADLKYVFGVAQEIGQTMLDYLMVITNSTVPVGNAEKLRGAVVSTLKHRGATFGLDVTSNPEFLKEGAAIEDFMKPDRIVVGVDSEQAQKTLDKLYRLFTMNVHPGILYGHPFRRGEQICHERQVGYEDFIKDIVNLFENMRVDMNCVRKGIGSDPRNGNSLIYPGIGYHGSCFPKDVKALACTGRENRHTIRILEAVEQVNDAQKSALYYIIGAYSGGNLQGKTIAFGDCPSSQIPTTCVRHRLLYWSAF
jgi:UDPglucose 6-dehydrogenase